VIVYAGGLQQVMHTDMTLTPSTVEVKVKSQMKLAKLQISLRIDLLHHFATAAMTVSALPGLFLQTYVRFTCS